MVMERADIDRVRLWCRDRSPQDRWAVERLECDVTGRHLDLVHVRIVPGGDDVRTPIARLLYTGQTRRWTLQWRDSGGRFQAYRHFPAVHDVREILGFLAEDPDPLFWPPD
nr:DUF3024 domain-containing protein [Propionibacterium sp.]